MHNIQDTQQAVMNKVQSSANYDPRAKIELTSRFDEDLGIDSLARIDLVVSIEKHFRVVLDEGELADVITVGDMIRAVDNALAK